MWVLSHLKATGGPAEGGWAKGVGGEGGVEVLKSTTEHNEAGSNDKTSNPTQFDIRQLFMVKC